MKLITSLDRMTNRKTVMLDDENYKPLRDLQAKIIKKTSETCSFSNVVNLVLEKGLKGFKV